MRDESACVLVALSDVQFLVGEAATQVPWHTTAFVIALIHIAKALWTRTAAPTPTFVDTLNDPNLSDVVFVVGSTGTKIRASRAILASASPFFATLFSAKWSDRDKPVPMPAWEPTAFSIALVHLYCGWVPGDEVTVAIRQALTKLKVDLDAMDLHAWDNLLDLAGMLERPHLASAARDEMIKLLDNKVAAITA
ncbi:hypothetical protein H9P43_007897 [Blastocladiella emersonii ATCC 22665]|nr:hypothetical protein H9P43_007897 [Blastocladiella emersonii ATCC 22665]